MQKVVVVYKANSAEALELARRLADWLGRRGRAALLHEAQAEPAGHAPSGPGLPPDCGLVVVLGGDGTMLGAVRETARAGLAHAPILGVNLGGLGFLTALAPEELLPALEMVLDGHFTAPPRLMLEASVHRPGAPERRVVALNDVVINKAALARIVELNLSVDDKPLTVFRADGLIIATPTGSTAYNLSAGGPICHPSLDCIVVTPICSFALSNRPLLLGPQMTLTVELGNRAQETTLTSDGQVGIQLLPGDRINIRRAEPSVRLIQSPFKDYFEILRTKLRWG